MKNDKKGISPVIATVLLIAMVIVIALIIFLWFRGFQGEAITKFGGRNVELVCEEITIDASYSGGILYLSNLGNVPVFQVKAKISNGGDFETRGLEELMDWPETGLTQGTVLTADINDFSGADEVALIPVLRGTSESGQKTHTCDEQYGIRVI